MTPEWYADLPSRLPACSPRWSSPAFAEELREWCSGILGPLTAAAETKLRGWSTVWRVETGDGVWYVKQNGPLQACEAGLTAELAALAPDHVVPVTAVDEERGLLMTPDLGPTLRESLGADPGDVDAWCRVVAAGAELQRLLAPSADRLVAAGLTPMPPAVCPAYAEERLGSLAALPAGHPQRLGEPQAARLRVRLPDVRRWAEQVAALGLPATLNHNDLHDANVFASDGRLCFFDFGDALLTEPLAVLMVPLGVVRQQLDAAPDDPRVRRVADAALEVWSDLASPADLRAALGPALRLACLGRVESWVRVCASFTDSELAEYGDGAPYWLLSLLDPPALSASPG